MTEAEAVMATVLSIEGACCRLLPWRRQPVRGAGRGGHARSKGCERSMPTSAGSSRSRPRPRPWLGHRREPTPRSARSSRSADGTDPVGIAEAACSRPSIPTISMGRPRRSPSSTRSWRQRHRMGRPASAASPGSWSRGCCCSWRSSSGADGAAEMSPGPRPPRSNGPTAAASMAVADPTYRIRRRRARHRPHDGWPRLGRPDRRDPDPARGRERLRPTTLADPVSRSRRACRAPGAGRCAASSTCLWRHSAAR